MKRKYLVLLAAIAALALILVGCSSSADEPSTEEGSTSTELSGSINVEGSDTLVNVAQAWAEAYMEVNPGVMITVKGGGSGAGIASLINGTCDFANASREVKDEEKTQATELGVEMVENEVARDGIAVMTNAANKVAGLTTEQLGKIYRGEITNWEDVGGADGKIVLLGRDTSSGTYEFFQETVVGKDLQYSKEMRNLQSNQAIVDELKGNENAIGYVGMGFESPELNVLEVDGKAASVDAVKDGSYALSRLLYMDSNGAPSELLKAYYDWIISPEGQAIVEAQGFVAL